MSFTIAAQKSYTALADQFQSICFREQAERLVIAFSNEFVSPSFKVGLEQKLVKLLINSNDETHYLDECGRKPLCKNRKDSKEVQAAVSKYQPYIARLPSRDQVEQRLSSALYTLYLQQKEPKDYLKRFIVRRVSELRPSYALPNDTTRLLILKQLLTVFDYFRDTDFYSKESEDFFTSLCGKTDVTALTDEVFQLRPDSDREARQKLRLSLHFFGTIAPATETAVRLLSAILNEDCLLKTDAPSYLSDLLKKPANDFADSDFLPDCIDECNELNDYINREKERLTNTLKNFSLEKLLAVQLSEKNLFMKKLSEEQKATELAEANAQMVLQAERFRTLIHSLPIDARLSAMAKCSSVIPLTEKLCTACAKISPAYRFENPTAKLLCDILQVKKIVSIRVQSINSSGLLSLLDVVENNLQLENLAEYCKAVIERLQLRRKDKQKELTKGASVPKEAAELLQAVNDLAQGFFPADRDIRPLIYLVAIAFEATFYTGAQNELYFEESDIAKNLFRDYYRDAVLTPDHSGRKKDENIDGYGVNYKSPLDVVFLYYLRKPELTPKQKLARICETLQRFRGEVKPTAPDSRATVHYKNLLLSQVFLLPEEQLVKFLVTNYASQANTVSVRTVPQKPLQKNTAAKTYRKILKELCELDSSGDLSYLFYDDSDDSVKGLSIGKTDRLLSFLESEYLRKQVCKSCEYFNPGANAWEPLFCPWRSKSGCTSAFQIYLKKKKSSPDWQEYLDEAQEDFNKKYAEQQRITAFLQSLSNISFLCEHSEDAAFKKGMRRISDRLKIATASSLQEAFGSLLCEKDLPTQVSRTKLIALYYFYIILKKWAEDTDEDPSQMSMAEFFDYFCNGKHCPAVGEDDSYCGFNTCLEAAGFPPISPKNLFDMTVICLAYKDRFHPSFTIPEFYPHTESLK